MIIIDNACRPDGVEALKLFKHMELLFFFVHLQIPTWPVGVNVFLLFSPCLFLMARPHSPSPSPSSLRPGVASLHPPNVSLSQTGALGAVLRVM